MFEIKGKYNTAKVFSDSADSVTQGQIIELLNQEFTTGSKIRFMPDLHAGKGCVVGTTMTIEDKIVPNIVGVDIGCGVIATNLGERKIDLPLLDKFIRNNIPHGFEINKDSYPVFPEIDSVICLKELGKSKEYFERSLGSLGGGNHFIEVNVNSNGEYILVIYSGSRNFGLQVANFYQNEAIKYLNGENESYKKAQKELIEKYKKAGIQKEISKALRNLKNEFKSPVPDALCYVEGDNFYKYIHDLEIAQRYASFNRFNMALRICSFLGVDPENSWETVHNYISNKIVRKGSVSAQEGELLIIPINMRDGSIIAKGKGNPDWNFSAPHGAGRLMSRGKAKELLEMKDFKNSMEGIYTTSVKESTLDEAPMAYKSIESILSNISETVEVLEVVKSVYNFKA